MARWFCRRLPRPGDTAASGERIKRAVTGLRAPLVGQRRTATATTAGAGDGKLSRAQENRPGARKTRLTRQGRGAAGADLHRRSPRPLATVWATWRSRRRRANGTAAATDVYAVEVRKVRVAREHGERPRAIRENVRRNVHRANFAKGLARGVPLTGRSPHQSASIVTSRFQPTRCRRADAAPRPEASPRIASTRRSTVATIARPALASAGAVAR
jgi:hypothetical protein